MSLSELSAPVPSSRVRQKTAFIAGHNINFDIYLQLNAPVNEMERGPGDAGKAPGNVGASPLLGIATGSSFSEHGSRLDRYAR